MSNDNQIHASVRQDLADLKALLLNSVEEDMDTSQYDRISNLLHRLTLNIEKLGTEAKDYEAAFDEIAILTKQCRQEVTSRQKRLKKELRALDKSEKGHIAYLKVKK